MVFTAVKYSTKLHLRYQIKKNNQKIGFCFCKRFFFVWSGIYSGSETDGIETPILFFYYSRLLRESDADIGFVVQNR